MSLQKFHPAVRKWFKDKFESPSEIQDFAWPRIYNKENVLLAAPTGSGKTLASFLAIINELIEKGLQGALEEKTYVVYVSPLKALSNDIEKNLREPLQGIRTTLFEMGFGDVEVTAKVRTGDTTPSDRAAMIKSPPHILVTTPESLFLLVTSTRGREMLKSVNTLIMDEIHAVVEDKRGSHLSLTVERLEKLSINKLNRIGISATQKPIIETAKFLVGNTNIDKKGEPDCVILDKGHKREIDLALEIPDTPLSALMSNEMWEEFYESLVNYVNGHKTTLIFVNTRRMAERLSHDLGKILGEEHITSHHGSLSREQRLLAEEKLKSGQLKALVATASLELGIDIGHVDLVCQIGSPRSISAFLQRVGRSGHWIGGTPKGRIYVTTRDELVEATALLDAVRRGELDTLIIPEKPIDILSQQIIAAAACDEWEEDELFELVSNAYPYTGLTRKEFDDTLEMMTVGFTNRRGYKRSYLHRDKVNKKVRARKGARLAVLQSGGAIPDLFDYDVIMEPTNTFVGTVNEDFAIESLPGDIFQLGISSWRVLKVENGVLRVEDAAGLPPTIPFWFGEAPGRTIELSQSVSRLRETIDELIQKDNEECGLLGDNLDSSTAVNTLEDRNNPYEKLKISSLNWLINEVGISKAGADQLVHYLLTAKLALGTIPSQNKLMLERFFDEVGDMHLVIHSPFGSDMNSAWGLALRKRFCRGFNFELQAAANEDCIILSLSQTHSFVLSEIYKYLKSKTVRHILIQAMLDAPMFEVRWRWNASRAMAVLRRRNGKKIPAQIQRMEAEDFVALAFPDQIACLENIVGDREIPDHPLVNQTIHDCLTEAMDIDLLEEVIRKIENEEVALLTAELREPSPLAQEIINARPYAFLDEAPAEERRTRAIQNRRWLDPADAKELGKLSPEAIDMVMKEAWPRVDSADELHDALVLLGFVTEEEAMRGNDDFGWDIFINELIENNRATRLQLPDGRIHWIASERIPEWQKIFPKATYDPKPDLPDDFFEKELDFETALLEVVRGRMESQGPVTEEKLASLLGVEVFHVQMALLKLEGQGFVFQGYYSPDVDEKEWVERRLLHRIHKYTLTSLRREIEPVSSQDFMRFLFKWQNCSEEDKLSGPEGLTEVLEKLEGFESAAGSWESDILPTRINNYDPSWLDILSLSGRVVWGRLRPFRSNGNGKSSPIKTTPVTLVKRENMCLWTCLAGSEKCGLEDLDQKSQRVYQSLKNNNSLFFDQIVKETELLSTQVEEALDVLAAHGFVTSDSFTGLRALLTPVNNRPDENGNKRNRKKAVFGMDHAGRWSLISSLCEEDRTVLDPDDVEYVARLLLRRYGVVFRKLFEQESFVPKWRDLLRVYRRMEACGEIRGGRFVSNVSGEQFALPEAVTLLRTTRNDKEQEEVIVISAVDPLNLTGVITTGRRISTLTGNRILYKGGIPVAVREAGTIQFLMELSEAEKWKLQNILIQKKAPPMLRAYLGKNSV